METKDTTSLLLREVTDGSVIYGILLADCPDAGKVASAVLHAKDEVSKKYLDEWQVADILEALPPEWNARISPPESIYL